MKEEINERALSKMVRINFGRANKASKIKVRKSQKIKSGEG